MLFTDGFRTIDKRTEGEFKDRGSRFTCYLFPVENEAQAKELLKQIKKEHHAAAHHCWAFVLGADSSLQKSSDDREPSGTAGRPVTRALLSAGITNVMAIVVRYFGGKLLGVPGLIHAYGAACNEAIKHASLVERVLYDKYFVPCAFEVQHELISLLKQAQLKFYPFTQNSQEGIIFEVKPSQVNVLEKQLVEAGLGGMRWIERVAC